MNLYRYTSGKRRGVLRKPILSAYFQSPEGLPPETNPCLGSIYVDEDEHAIAISYLPQSGADDHVLNELEQLHWMATADVPTQLTTNGELQSEKTRYGSRWFVVDVPNDYLTTMGKNIEDMPEPTRYPKSGVESSLHPLTRWQIGLIALLVVVAIVKMHDLGWLNF